jgi:transposase
MVDDIFDNSRPRGRVEIRTGVGRRRRWTEEQKGRIVAESYRAGAIVSEVARRYEISPQHLFAWRKTARAGLLTLPNEGELTFVPIVTPGDNSATVGNPQESRLIRIEIAGAVVHAEPGVDVVFLTDVLRALKAAA